MAKPIGEKRNSKAVAANPERKTPARQTSPELPKRARSGSPNEVSVNFAVSVPEGTSKYRRSVYLAGTLQNLDKRMPEWDPRGQEMKKVDKSHWTITLTGPADAQIEYKYTLGSWDHVEKGVNCSEIRNRKVTLSPDQAHQVDDTVQAWRDMGCG